MNIKELFSVFSYCYNIYFITVYLRLVINRIKSRREKGPDFSVLFDFLFDDNLVLHN
jgi:hypothetical protein